MASKYSIHKAFRFVPSIHLRFSRVPVAFSNVAFRVMRGFQFRRRADVAVQEVKIQSGKRNLKLKIFRPTAHPERRSRACLIYFHGGAFFLTYAGSHLHSAAEYAARLDAVVVFVDYALGAFPVGFDDCYEAAKWVFEHADQLGIDAGCLLVGGDSAGGGLAASVAQRALDERAFPLLGQLLIYPVIDRSCSSESVEKYVDVPIWTGVSNRRMWKKYLEGFSEDSAPPYAAAGDREDLDGLPRAYVELAEFDPLHDEGMEYAQRLERDGVEVELNDTRGTVHGYDGLAPRHPITVDAMNRRIAFMQGCLGVRSA